MALKGIRVEGFKSIKLLDLELRALNIMIGANGAGKSNFLALFKLVNAIAETNLQSFVAVNGGPDSFLYFGRKETDRIELRLFFDGFEYGARLMPTVNNRLIFDREHARFETPRDINGSDLQLNSFSSEESILPREADQKSNPKVKEGLSILQSWKVYHLNDTSDQAQIKRLQGTNDNLFLRPDARNLAAFLYGLQHSNRKHYNHIRDTIRLVAPFFGDFALRVDPANANLIQLEWNEKGSNFPFQAHHLSDGTLRFMALATLLLQPNPPATILIDEPELGLHPYAINVLAALIQSASHRTQLIISTQSSALVDQFEVEDMLIVERSSQQASSGNIREFTEIKRLDGKNYLDWLEEYSLGELWEKNVFGGRP